MYLLSLQRGFPAISYFSSMKWTLWGIFFPSLFSSLMTLLLTLLWAVKCCSCHFLFHDWADKRQVSAAHALDTESNRDGYLGFFFRCQVFVSVSVSLQIHYFSTPSSEAAIPFHTCSKQRHWKDVTSTYSIRKLTVIFITFR